MKLSKHSKDRMKQRVGIKSEKIAKNFFKNALQNGISPEQVEDSLLKQKSPPKDPGVAELQEIIDEQELEICQLR